MITVKGRAACRTAFDYSDEWIPIKMAWDIEQPRGMRYLRISGKRGGEFEIKIDSSNGAIYQFIALELPTAEATITDRNANDHLNSAPIIDLSPWAEESVDTASVLPKYITADVGITRTDEFTIIAVQNSDVDEWLICGPVSVGVSKARTMVAIRLRPSSEDT
ncbi:hypothetical protein [Nocardia sp. NPDC023988]|uniref:hypothetical protein n=1 Tax=unclassified Nocardia TaxID=2637762 RepID=UPI003409F0D7